MSMGFILEPINTEFVDSLVEPMNLSLLFLLATCMVRISWVEFNPSWL